MSKKAHKTISGDTAHESHTVDRTRLERMLAVALNEYKTLTATDRKNAAENRLRQLEQEHYSHSLFLEEAKQTPGAEAEVTQRQEVLDGLEARIGVARAALNDAEAEARKATKASDNSSASKAQ